MCSYTDDEDWVYNDEDFAGYEDYIGEEDDIEKVLEEVVVDDDDDATPPPAEDLDLEEEAEVVDAEEEA
jgi:hypothetical protein